MGLEFGFTLIATNRSSLCDYRKAASLQPIELRYFSRLIMLFNISTPQSSLLLAIIIVLADLSY